MNNSMRSVVAVIAGYEAMVVIVIVCTMIAGPLLASGVISGELDQAPVPYLAVNLVYGVVAAAVGGWLAAKIGSHALLAHGIALAAVLVVLSAALGFQPQPGQPSWYPVTVALLGAIGAIAGARYRAQTTTAC